MTSTYTDAGKPKGIGDYLRDIRVIQVIAQIVFTVALVGFLAIIWISILGTLEKKNLAPGFDFLERRAGFAISESPEWYTPESTYGEAFLVGVVNTLRIVLIGLFGATSLGVLIGVLLLSNNWLIRAISRIYVEILRNTPLLVQLIFWYFVVMLSLPADDIAIPNESILILPWRYPLYLLFILALFLYSRRTSYPARLMTGVVGSVVIMEITYALLGYSTDIALMFGLLGLLLFIFSWFAKRDISIFLFGLAFIPIANVVAHVFLYIFSVLGLLSNPQAYVGEIYPAIYVGLKGFVFPIAFTTSQFGAWMAFVVAGVLLAIALWIILGHITETTGKPYSRFWYAFFSIVILAVMGWFIVNMNALPVDVVDIDPATGEATVINPQELDVRGELSVEQKRLYSGDPLIIELPKQNKFGRVEIGTGVSLPYMSLLLGLVVYTSAFIAEIVRAGIQAVPFGQIEAARALGLSASQTLVQIVLPQALRVIIPPMGNQWLNLSKNSSLATAIAYADTYAVGITIMNQSGQSVTGFTLILLVYLTLSLIISLFMNFMNSRFQIVTR
ncbi:hypothetical protein MASR2M15_28880 [Anaerolineales bacterium]